MHQSFRDAVEALHPAFERLMAMRPSTFGNLPPAVPTRGVYLFSEGDRHLYVGRSNDIRGRLGRHCRHGATHRMAAFAFKLAREATGKTIATYQKDGSRDDLIKEPTFLAAFQDAKARIRAMS